MNCNKLALALTLAALVIFAAAAPARCQEQPGDHPVESLQPRSELQQWGDPKTDRASCEEECKMKYGMTLYYILHGGGGGGWSWSGKYWLYAKCIEDCDKQFWRRFDKETGDLEKTK